jgi:hypothetical protein
MALQRENKTVEERLILVEGFQENTERHYTELKGKLETTSDDVTEIKKAILGSDFNEKKGLVYIINDVDRRVKIIEQKQVEYEIYLNQFKWVIGVVTTVFVAFGVYLLKLVK